MGLLRKLSACAALGALLLTSCAATLRLSATAPVQDDGGLTCTAPVLSTRTGATTMHFAWTGPAAGEDSLVGILAGTVANFTRAGLPPGLYTVRAWASDVGGAGCDTTISVTVRGRPARVRDLR